MRFWIALLFLLPFTPAYATPIPVKSGEHDGFSRLVVYLPASASRALAPVDGGFRLATDASDPQYAFQNVFELIPRDRLKALVAEPDGTLLLKLASGIVPETFSLESGAFVIDLKNIPPDEAALSPAAAVRDRAKSSPTNAPRPSTPPRQKTVQPVAIGRDYLDLFWQPPHMREATAAPVTISDGAPKPQIPPKPDPRLDGIEESLLRQISRAASQGLVSAQVKPPEVQPEKSGQEAKSPASKAAPESDYDPIGPPPPTPPPYLAVDSMTVIDRDHLVTPPQPQLEVSACPPDRYFDLASWIDERPAFAQISDARRDLLGEFDVPNPRKVMALARLYIAFGFGTESRALLRDMGKDGPGKDALLFVGSVLDQDPAAAASPLARLTDCDGAVALWAFLASDPPPEKRDVAFAALRRNFETLPADLRRSLAPKLVARLTQIRAADVARSLEPAVSRVTTEDRTALDTVEAEIQAKEAVPQALGNLEALSKTNSEQGLRALILWLNGQIDAGGEVDPAALANAEALAFELAKAPEAPELRRIAAIGHAANSEFPKAFEIYADPTTIADPNGTLAAIFTRLVGQASDAVFLRTLYDELPLAEEVARIPDLRHELAGRAISLGMPAVAVRLLGKAAPLTEQDKTLLARAALLELDPAAALAHLKDLGGQQVEQLRAEALSRLGRHNDARAAYLRAGNPEDARAQSWHKGDWSNLETSPDAVEKQFLETFGAAPSPGTEIQGGPITQARSLLERSQAERETLSKMLDRLALPTAQE
ncbi:hypothetical protein [Thioclava sp. DLFJ4-1]|uniref:hypothetical protein n=1 Tax=Thioclava sp. DLFJ4-1 TaxID=1915313 RepID=UPI0009974CB0|nr:hypothetical protein [Thioclava sp. DLFJ4-1]OOY14634.1 hypothetical protein BMI85_18435 [Thioclava sp. DLFJ4-1]